jgi:environmental stress-induced protein Ves
VNGVAGYVNLSSEGEHVAHEETHKRRLPRTRWSNKEGELTTIERQANASKRDMSARVSHADVAQRDDWRFAFSYVCHIGKITHHQARSL